MTFNQRFPTIYESARNLFLINRALLVLGLLGVVASIATIGQPRPYKYLAILFGGSCLVATIPLKRNENFVKLELQMAEEAYLDGWQAELAQQFKPPTVIPGEEKVIEALPPAIELYDWSDIADEAVGFIIAGNSGSAKTSVACWLAGHLTQKQPAQILALDSHANRNPLWQELGIPVIEKVEAIEQQITLLIQLLDWRQTQPENGDDIVVFADEINANIRRFEHPAQMEIALERLGSEGRKYGITFIALNQSKNVDDIGISAAMRNNYVLVLLGAAARSEAERLWKQTDPRRQQIESVAYPCLLCGSMPSTVAVHPTHHSYSQFRKKGNAPKNIKPINQLPLTIKLPLGYEHLRAGDEASELAGLLSQTEQSTTGTHAGSLAVRNGSANPAESIRTHWVRSAEPLLDLDLEFIEPSEPVSKEVLFSDEITHLEEQWVLKLWRKDELRSLQGICKQVWNAAKGGGATWMTARAKCKQILTENGEDAPWLDD